jgi:VanZ family protein
MKALRYWWPAIVWAGAIFFFSTRVFGGESTSRFIIPFLRWLLPSAEMPTLWQLHFLIRKSAHVANYFVFSWLVLSGLRGEAIGWRWSWAAWALLVAAGYAALDEFHQSFVPGRGAAAQDVLLDSAGAAMAQLAAALCSKKTKHETTDEHR